LAKIDLFVIPFYVRALTMIKTFFQIIIVDNLTEFIANNLLLQQTNSLQYFLDNELSSVMVKQPHRMIKQYCKSIHTLLADKKHDEAILWVKQYCVNHPLKKELAKTVTYLTSLCDSYSTEASKINDKILFFSKSHLIDECQTMIINYIIRHKHILLLKNSGASNEDIAYYLHDNN